MANIPDTSTQIEMSFPAHYSDFPQQAVSSADDAASAATNSAYASSVSEAPLPSPTGSNRQKRRSSKIKAGKQISRSSSTPHMREPLMSDSEADKKRNKLGYQRISIACAHCRRRKIRCLLSDGDTHQRCQNCIRLKKECVFYPVEQQTAIDNRSDTMSTQASAGGAPSVDSASPTAITLERSFEPSRNFPAFSSLPASVPTTFEGLPLESGGAVAGHGGLNHTTNYSHQGAQSAHRWPQDPGVGSAPVPLAMQGMEGAVHMPFSDHGTSGDFAPYPNHDAVRVSSYHTTPGMHFASANGEHMWMHQSQPMRSMSYGQIESLPVGQPSYGMDAQPRTGNPVSSVRYVSATTAPRDTPMGSQALAQHPLPSNAPMHPFMQSQGYQGSVNPHSFGNGQLQQQAYPTGWYPSHPAYSTFTEEPDDYQNRQTRPG